MTEAGSPHQPERVVDEDALRYRDQTSLAQVGQAPERIDEVLLTHGDSHSIRCEIPLGQVVEDATTSNRGHVDVALTTHHAVSQVTFGQDKPRSTKRAGDLSGNRRGVVGYHDVQIGGVATQLTVAHAATHQPTRGLAVPQDIGQGPQRHLAPPMARPSGAATSRGLSTCADSVRT